MMTFQEKGTFMRAGSVGATNDTTTTEDSDRGIDVGITWCWRLVDAVRVLVKDVVVLCGPFGNLDGAGYGAKLSDEGRLVRCRG